MWRMMTMCSHWCSYVMKVLARFGLALDGAAARPDDDHEDWLGIG
jgi:hypothetical protein